MMTINVFSGDCLVDSKDFTDETKALDWASEQQDAGFRVRLVGFE